MNLKQIRPLSLRDAETMKNCVFADTVAWLALVNKSEHLHDADRSVRDQLIQQKAKLITTELIEQKILSVGIDNDALSFINVSELQLPCAPPQPVLQYPYPWSAMST